MAYTKTTWRETGMTTTEKVSALNNMETQYDEMMSLFDAHTHTNRYYTRTEMDAKYYSANNDGDGSGFVAETLDGYTAQQIISSAIPSGVIAIWNGDANSVPTGWRVCDGGGGTPDLRDRFVVGAGGTLSPGATGGQKNVQPTCTFTSAGHTLSAAELPIHSHTYVDKSPTSTDTSPVGGGYYPTNVTRETYYTETAGGVYTGSTQPHYHQNCSLSINQLDIRPPWMAKLFIMKL